MIVVSDCRGCGVSVCNTCSPYQLPFPHLGFMTPQRCCAQCFQVTLVGGSVKGSKDASGKVPMLMSVSEESCTPFLAATTSEVPTSMQPITITQLGDVTIPSNGIIEGDNAPIAPPFDFIPEASSMDSFSSIPIAPPLTPDHPVQKPLSAHAQHIHATLQRTIVPAPEMSADMMASLSMSASSPASVAVPEASRDSILDSIRRFKNGSFKLKSIIEDENVPVLQRTMSSPSRLETSTPPSTPCRHATPRTPLSARGDGSLMNNLMASISKRRLGIEYGSDTKGRGEVMEGEEECVEGGMKEGLKRRLSFVNGKVSKMR